MVVGGVGKVIIVSVLSLSLREIDRKKDRQIEREREKEEVRDRESLTTMMESFVPLN